MTKVYAVASYDNYYPSPNNVEAVFSTEEAAQEYLTMIQTSKYWVMDHYDIFVYSVFDGVDEV